MYVRSARTTLGSAEEGGREEKKHERKKGGSETNGSREARCSWEKGPEAKGRMRKRTGSG
jgi:hypothetical protein